MMRLSRRDLQAISDRVLKAYRRLPEAAADPARIDPDLLLTALLKLTIDYRHLSEDGRTLGITSFDEVGIEVFDGPEDMYFLDGKTVLIEDALNADRERIGRRNFTVMHEGSHHILNMLFPGEYKGGVNARRVLRYRISTGYRQPSRNWEEWQTDTLASLLLMPFDLVKENMKVVGLENGIPILNRLYRPKEYERFVAVTERMGVSKQALSIRLRQMGMLGIDQLANPNELIDIYAEECT